MSEGQTIEQTLQGGWRIANRDDGPFQIRIFPQINCCG